MIEDFKNKFEEKTDQELLYILDNKCSYQEDALEAARLILEWRKQEGISIESKPIDDRDTSDEYNPVLVNLNPIPFLKAFNKKDLLTSFCIGFLGFSIIRFLKFYESEPFFENYNWIYILSLFPILFLLNHFFYRIDHKRLNNLAGRFFHSVLTVTFLIVFSSITHYLNTEYIEIFLEFFNLADFFIFSVLIFVIEIFITLFQRIFLFFKFHNSLKLKIVLCVSALTVTLGISLIQNNFYRKPIYKRWSTLSWSDFKGMGRPFTAFDAGISSKIYLELDSISRSYIAYAAQNNQRSWKRHKDENSYPFLLLLHEQYHFNIAEVFTRKMNTFIKDNPNQNYSFYKQKLRDFTIEENAMQKRYDDESNHSIEVDKQISWEYKIDSLLQYYDGKSGMITDSLTGASAYFTETPIFKIEFDSIDNFEYRYYYRNKYEMEMLLMSFKSSEYEIDNTELILDSYYDVNKIRIVSKEKEVIDNDTVYHIFAQDKNDTKMYKTLWFFSQPYSYHVSAQYEYEYNVYPLYSRIADNFINSFTIQPIQNSYD